VVVATRGISVQLRCGVEEPRHWHTPRDVEPQALGRVAVAPVATAPLGRPLVVATTGWVREACGGVREMEGAGWSGHARSKVAACDIRATRLVAARSCSSTQLQQQLNKPAGLRSGGAHAFQRHRSSRVFDWYCALCVLGEFKYAHKLYLTWLNKHRRADRWPNPGAEGQSPSLPLHGLIAITTKPLITSIIAAEARRRKEEVVG